MELPSCLIPSRPRDDLRYLSSLERTLRRMLNGVQLKSIEQWFERQADEAAADLRAELVG